MYISEYPNKENANHNTKLLCLLVPVCIEKKEEKLCPGSNAADYSKEEYKEDCAERCYETPRCMAWTFGSPKLTSGTMCWLKTQGNCTRSVPGTDWVWGTRGCKDQKNSTIFNVY